MCHKIEDNVTPTKIKKKTLKLQKINIKKKNKIWLTKKSNVWNYFMYCADGSTVIAFEQIKMIGFNVSNSFIFANVAQIINSFIQNGSFLHVGIGTLLDCYFQKGFFYCNTYTNTNTYQKCDNFFFDTFFLYRFFCLWDNVLTVEGGTERIATCPHLFH